MNDNAKPIRTMTLTAIVLQAAVTLIILTVHMCPKPFLTLFYSDPAVLENTAALRHPMQFANPLLRMIVVAVFGYFLLQQSKKPTALAPVLLILIPVSTVVLSLIGIGLSFLNTVLVTRLYSTAEVGALSVVNTVSGWTGILSAPVFVLLAAAAGINYCRHRNALP